MRSGEAPDSVHLATWPKADEGLIDRELTAQMAPGAAAGGTGPLRPCRGLAGHPPAAPARPGGCARVRGPARRAARPGREELNVRTLEPLGDVTGDLVSYVVKPNFRALGRRFGRRTQALAAAISSADPGRVARGLKDGGQASVIVDGEPVTIGADEVIVTQTPREGWQVASDAGETVALDLSITPELRREGLAREVIRLVQDARKADGLDVSDRITLRWDAASPELATALAEHGQLIAGEVLATEFRSGAPGHGEPTGTEHSDADLGLTFWIGQARS